MMTLKDITIKQAYKHGYGRGAVPGFEGSVELQFGERYADRVTITLTPDELRDVIGLAVSKVMARLATSPMIDVEGAPGEEPPAPLPVSDDAPDAVAF